MSGSAPADKMAPGVEPPRSTRLTVTALRRAVAVRMWGGKGCGAPCDFCRMLVTQTDVEYEVEAQLDGVTVMLHFHPPCHDAWQTGQEPAPTAAPTEVEPTDETQPPSAA